MGGHQNAHKKERMKKKRLQLQARRATVSSFYLHAPPNPTTAAARWFYEPATSSCDIDDEIGGGGRQISFTHRPDYFSGYDVSNNDEHRGGGFTLTHHRPVGGGGRRSGKAAAAAGSRGGTDYLDLELGLRLQ
ncbi:unnamed protein product [Linum tenue]|uniref:C2H2-type domain-containing protein n=1 Tax=Linum tenue TaxID=586396 RepID=A0AAV0S7C2_9ROSI|nr:unnamed protein product [Linum tenue]CAI0627553.1 unnamed protein product [Linum tenue]